MVLLRRRGFTRAVAIFFSAGFIFHAQFVGAENAAATGLQVVEAGSKEKETLPTLPDTDLPAHCRNEGRVEM